MGYITRCKDISVFPTPVGVFLLLSPKLDGFRGLPHARGGVSTCKSRRVKAAGSSPRPWGCFQGAPRFGWDAQVFPTPVGVFL